MKPEFFYHRKDGYDRFRASGMSLAEMAVEPAYIARKLYATIKKQNPVHAEAFRKMVIDAVTAPMTWDVSTAPEQDLEMFITVPGKTETLN